MTSEIQKQKKGNKLDPEELIIEAKLAKDIKQLARKARMSRKEGGYDEDHWCCGRSHLDEGKLAEKMGLFPEAFELYMEDRDRGTKNAARLLAKLGHYEIALNFFLSRYGFPGGCELFQTAEKINPHRAINIFVKHEDYSGAAHVAEKAGLLKEAIELYLREANEKDIEYYGAVNGKYWLFSNAAYVAEKAGNLELKLEFSQKSQRLQEEKKYLLRKHNEEVDKIMSNPQNENCYFLGMPLEIMNGSDQSVSVDITEESNKHGPSKNLPGTFSSLPLIL